MTGEPDTGNQPQHHPLYWKYGIKDEAKTMTSNKITK